MMRGGRETRERELLGGRIFFLINRTFRLDSGVDSGQGLLSGSGQEPKHKDKAIDK